MYMCNSLDVLETLMDLKRVGETVYQMKDDIQMTEQEASNQNTCVSIEKWGINS